MSAQLSFPSKLKVQPAFKADPKSALIVLELLMRGNER